jgi:hypothetical protein
MAVGRRGCPSRQLRRRSTSWYSSVSDSMSSAQATSRLKQIDGRSCTGNVNLLKLGWPTSPSAERRGRGHFGEHEVVMFQRSPKDSSRMALRGRRSSSWAADALESLEALGAANPSGYSRQGAERPQERTPLSPRHLCVCRQCEAPRLSRKIHLLLVRFNPSFAHCVATPARPPIRLGKVRPTGEAAEAQPADDLCEPGPGVWPLRLAKRQCGGERMAAAPA